MACPSWLLGKKRGMTLVDVHAMDITLDLVLGVLEVKACNILAKAYGRLSLA